ncbi:MAG: GGDEF domain-containing protein [gamma proteobacterium symbiont of Taylorina sp.]|nr:GGDEF domain-containing protein [gamma proteobacterium symbiont of Taylorina sp.]
MAENTAQWKKKYYDGLDRLERREKEWQELEDLFKQAISRLTLAAEGKTKSLDMGLNQLRTAIRKGKDNNTIEFVLESVSKEIIKLDRQKKSEPTGDAGFLVKIIKQMALQGRAEKKSLSLIKRVNAKKPPEQHELIQSFTELLSEVVSQAVIDNEKEISKDSSKQGGFFNHLFSKKKPSKEQPVGQEPSASQQPSTDDKKLVDIVEQQSQEDEIVQLNQEQLSSVVFTVQNVLDSIIDGLDLDDKVKEQLKDRVLDVKPTKEIHVLLDDLKDILEDAGVADSSTLDRIKDDCRDEEYQNLLISLIEYLPLEESTKVKAEQLKETFSQGVSTKQLPKALKSIAALISKMYGNVQQEQREFELFLKNLSGRLQEVDQFLQNNFQENQQSYQDGVALDNVVKEQVKSIGHSVASVKNLEDLESTIQVYLDQIVSHLDNHRMKEDERVTRVEAQNSQLSEKLKNLELESDRLREDVLESQNRALIDPLTQLPNRLAYDQRLKQEYARWKRYNNTLLIMVWDIDLFKSVNDNYGHQAGDEALKSVANMLRNSLRETDFIFRFGGEEFVTLMPETSLGGGFKIAEKVRAAVEKLKIQHDENEIKVTISCGITIFVEHDTLESAFERADKALYQAKDQGRNRCVIAKMV